MEASLVQAITQIKAAVDLLNEFELFCSTNTANWVNKENALGEVIEGEGGLQAMAALKGMRSGLSSRLSPDQVSAVLAPLVADVVKAINLPDGGPRRNMVEWRDYCIAQTPDETVNRWEHAYGAVTLAGTGTGTLRRLTVDEDGYPLEATHGEAKTATCVQDQNQVDEYEEVFEFEGTDREPDWCKVAGSGARTLHSVISSRMVNRYVTNSDWSQYAGTTQPTAGNDKTPTSTTAVTGWILSATASFSVTVDTVYHGSPGVATPKSLGFVDNGNVSQILQDNRDPEISEVLPYYWEVPVYRAASCDGTLTRQYGAHSTAVDVTTLNNAAWNVLPGPLDKNHYYKNFKEADLDIKYTLASNTVGTLWLGPVMFHPFRLFDGLWYAPVAGATSFIRDDKFSWTDTWGGTRAKLQYWLALRTGWGISLPSVAGGTETIIDP